MLIAFDTATQTASIAIYDLATRTLLSEWTWQARRRQTQELLGTAQLMLQQLALSPQDISALAVTTGPGSFTGVRIAISAAKGIGLGLATPPVVVGLPTLSVTAAPFLASAPSQNSTICAYLRAGRGRYNWAYVSQGGEKSSLLWQPAVADHESGTAVDFVNSLHARSLSSTQEDRNSSGEILLVGEKTVELEDAVSGISNVHLVDEISSTRRAGQLARLAVAHIDAGNSSSIATLSPLYLRSP